MKVSHVLYKVHNLEEGVRAFQEKGFHVEYGSKSHPHNALIYFPNGPYIELLSAAPVPKYAQVLLRLIGKGKVADRFKRWASVEEGFFGLCLENYEQDFRSEEKILNNYAQKYFITDSGRTDPMDRVLKWKLLFPYALKLPFLMTYFNVDPKPTVVKHPNGIKQIIKVSFGTDESLIPVIQALCDDEILNIHLGFGVSEVIYS